MKQAKYFIALVICSFLLASCERQNEASSNDLSVTNSTAVKVLNQNTNQSENWHWDQAKADALKAKIARDHNWSDINTYEQMLSEKLEHEPPTNNVGLPNFAAGLACLSHWA